MHLPDAFLDAKTVVLTSGLAAAGVGYSLKQLRTTLEPRRVPLLGLAAAFVFAAQMLNFPVPGGTSGHLIGGVLTSVLLGPAAAVVVITCVLIVQCLMFADGGLLALGANTFNMAILNVCGGTLAYRATMALFPMSQNRAVVFAAGFAGWVGTVLSSIGCAGQLAFSGTARWEVTFPAMANIHMVIGLGEGLATALICRALLQKVATGEKAAILRSEPRAPKFALVLGGLIVAGLIIFVAPFASPLPDGLHKVAQRLGFSSKLSEPLMGAPLPDYSVPFLSNAIMGTVLAGLAGSLLVFTAAYFLARILVPEKISET